MKYSIIIPLYNKEKYIKNTIKSVLAQNFKDFEIIVVDDGSTDASCNIVKSCDDNRIKLYTKTNGGVSVARNYGISVSSGEVICFLDADDIWCDTYLSELDKSVNENPSISFFCGAYSIFQETTDNIIKTKDLSSYSSGHRSIVDYFKASVYFFGSIALTSAVAIRRSYLKSLDGLFDETICIGEDNDMWVRACLKTDVLYNNKPLMLYRSFAEGSLTKSKYNFKNSIDYSKWYAYSSNKKLKKFATQMSYTLARRCYNDRAYSEAITVLGRIKGANYICRRFVLYFMSLCGIIFKFK